MLYFAYGSNMPCARLNERVPSARLVDTGTLSGHELRFHKIGKDGTGKADAFHTGEATDSVIGAVYKIDPAEKDVLDRFEPGYKAKAIDVVTASGEKVKAFTYCAEKINETLKPYCWYMHHVVAGAKEHDLPDEYIKYLEAIKLVPDEDRERRERELRIYK